MSLFPKYAINVARAWARGMRETRPTAPVPDAPKWTSSAYHVEVLGSTRCECGAEKRVGDYRCAPCVRSSRP